nr:putative ribonuclease H-like domain-containing protein [Tanacetum cinerariifolium]
MVRRIQTENETEFGNQTLRDYYEEVGISHETSVARSPQQNGVVERRNRTLIEAAHTMLIYILLKIDPSFAFDMERQLMSFYIVNFLTYHFFMCLVLSAIQQRIVRIWSSSGPALNEMTPGTISSGLVQKSSPSTSYVPPLRNDWDLLFQPMFDELFNPPPSVVNQAPEVIAPIAKVIHPVHVYSTGSPSSTTVDQDAPSLSKSHTTTKIRT